MIGSDRYDPSKGDEFEDFDVTTETNAETETEMTVESLGGLGDSTDQMQSLMGARDELEQRLMRPPGSTGVASTSAFDNDVEPYDPGNLVGFCIGKKIGR